MNVGTSNQAKGLWVDPQRLFLDMAVIGKVKEEYITICEATTGAKRDEKLRQWGKRWHLDAPWCIERALGGDQHVFANGWEPPPFTFACPGWPPDLHGWKDTEARFDAAYAEAKRAYQQTIEERLRELKWLDPKEQHDEQHFVWAVKFQVRGWTFARIARWEAGWKRRAITDEAVRLAVTKVIGRIGLTLASRSKGGRPKKPPS